MNRLIVCVGKYAKTPYRIQDIRRDIFCIEELCYYLCEYVNLLDHDIMDDKLAIWLDEECGLSKLSKQLLELIHHKGSLAAFVSSILETAYYANREEIKAIVQILRQNEQLNVYERKKKRADNLIKEKKYYYGLDIYHQLLKEIPESDYMLLSKVYYNCGVAYARLFYYEIAQELFEQALALNNDEEIKMAFLYCKRAVLKKDEYIDFITNQRSYYEAGFMLEQRLIELENVYETSDMKKELDAVLDKKATQDALSYYEKIEHQLYDWEAEYNIMTRLT